MTTPTVWTEERNAVMRRMLRGDVTDSEALCIINLLPGPQVSERGYASQRVKVKELAREEAFFALHSRRQLPPVGRPITRKPIAHLFDVAEQPVAVRGKASRPQFSMLGHM